MANHHEEEPRVYLLQFDDSGMTRGKSFKYCKEFLDMISGVTSRADIKFIMMPKSIDVIKL